MDIDMVILNEKLVAIKPINNKNIVTEQLKFDHALRRSYGLKRAHRKLHYKQSQIDESHTENGEVSFTNDNVTGRTCASLFFANK